MSNRFVPSICKPPAVVLSLLLTVLAGVASGESNRNTTWTVDDDGQFPADFSTIQDAIDAASDGDTVFVYGGTYTGSGSSSTPVIDLKGKTLRVVSQMFADVLVDGQGVRPCLVIASGQDRTCEIRGLTFVNGSANDGGGVLVENSSPTLLGCYFYDNGALRGGGLLVRSGAPLIQGCVFIDNDATWGGGIYLRETDAVIEGCFLRNNEATSLGGGLRIYAPLGGPATSPRIEDTLFRDNQAPDGGGLASYGPGSPEVVDCEFETNVAQQGSGGGAFHAEGSDASYFDCIFSGNRALGSGSGAGEGAGLYCSDSNVKLEGSTLEGGEADTAGGGVFGLDSDLFLASNIIRNNVASLSGGGLAATGGGGAVIAYDNLFCQNSPDQLSGSWSELGTNCIGDSCEDEDLDGIIDACDDDIPFSTRRVPSEYATVAEAYAAAVEGDVILCASGTHQVPDNGGQGLLLDSKNVTLRSEQGAGFTFLQAAGPSQAGRVLTCVNLSTETVIEGFTIRDGYASGSFGLGGGILATDTDARFVECWIKNNLASYAGGGMLVQGDSNIVLQQCEFVTNSSGAGGALTVAGGSAMLLQDCFVGSNSANAYGGGIFTLGDLTLEDSSVNNNLSVGKRGAGILTWGGVTTIRNSIFFDNVFDPGNPEFPPTSSDLQISKGGSVVMDAANDFETMEAGSPSEGAIGGFRLNQGSATAVAGDVRSPAGGGLIIDLDDLTGDPPLSCGGTFTQRGCLTLVNPSESLFEASVGTQIPLLQSVILDADDATVVFPAMPDGRGLRLIQDVDPARGGGTTLGVEVIDVDTPTFADPFSQNVNATPVDMVAADVDGDGIQELAVVFAGTPGSVAVYDVQTGSPVLIPGLGRTVGDHPVDLDAGDLDGDGDDDLAVAVAGDQQVVVLTALSSSFASRVINTPGGVPTCVAIADWDGDLARDVVVGVDVAGAAEDEFRITLDVLDVPVTGPILVIPAAGEPPLVPNFPDAPSAVAGGGSEVGWGFVGATQNGMAYAYRSGQSRTELASVGENRITQITAKDIDESGGDGWLDVILASDEGELVVIVPGLSSGFDLPIPILVDEPVAEFVALDVDLDDDVDLVLASPLSASNSLLVLRNDAPETSVRTTLRNRRWSKQSLNSSILTRQLASGKLDPKDEEDDWVLGSGEAVGSRGVSSLLEQTTPRLAVPPCPGDATGDGIVNIDDVLVVIADFGGAGDGDLDGNGIVDVDDLLEVLESFGQPCPSGGR